MLVFDKAIMQWVTILACLGAYPAALCVFLSLRYRFKPPANRIDEDGFLFVAVPSTLAFALTIGGGVANLFGLEISLTYFSGAGFVLLMLLLMSGAALVRREHKAKKPRGLWGTWLIGLAIGLIALLIVNGLVLAGLVIRNPFTPT